MKIYDPNLDQPNSPKDNSPVSNRSKESTNSPIQRWKTRKEKHTKSVETNIELGIKETKQSSVKSFNHCKLSQKQSSKNILHFNDPSDSPKKPKKTWKVANLDNSVLEFKKQLNINITKCKIDRKRGFGQKSNLNKICIQIKNKRQSDITIENILNKHKTDIDNLIKKSIEINKHQNSNISPSNSPSVYDSSPCKKNKEKSNFLQYNKTSDFCLFSPSHLKDTVFKRKKLNYNYSLTPTKSHNESASSPGKKKNHQLMDTNICFFSNSEKEASSFSFKSSSDNTLTDSELLFSDQSRGSFPFLGENVVALDQEIKYYDKLEIKDIVGDIFLKQKVLIDAGGLSGGGLRNKRDGISSFGLISQQKKVVKNKNIKLYGKKDINEIDYIMNIQTKLEDENIPDEGDVIFQIIFSEKAQRYVFRPNLKNKSNITIFKKVNKRIPIFYGKSVIINKIIYLFQPDYNCPEKITVIQINQNNLILSKTNYSVNDAVYKTLGSGEILKLFFVPYNNNWYLSYYEEKSLWILNNDSFMTTDYKEPCWEILEKDIGIDKSEIFKIGKNVFQVSIKYNK